ncbi:phytoene dehydrogenase-like protein [Bradyrhizobium sp. AZCC 1678]|uniref:flavin monoamine oxidase family protein n=1 Tax=Bradyrhizobium sp. AZCC 1678 TaxID=3117030 RepID=UPI002FF378C8
MHKHIDRRRLLEFLAALGAGSLSGCGDDVASTSTGGNLGTNGKGVIVLGGGLAGLTAAYNLMHKGYDIILLEGQDRVGGRVLTVRDGFKAGGHAEMGATRIFSTHAATLKYVKLFGLGPLKAYDEGKPVFFMRGQRFKPPSAGYSWPIADMTEAEKADPASFFGPYLHTGFEKVGDPHAANWPNDQPSALDLDKVAFEQYLLNQGASPGWVDWFRAMEGNIKRINACAGFAVEKVAAGVDGELPTSIPGGNDRLPQGLFRRARRAGQAQQQGRAP